MSSEIFDHNNISEIPQDGSTASLVLAMVKRNVFWKIIENEMGICLPKYLKCLLHFLGFESAAALKNFELKYFHDMEMFAVNKLPLLLCVNDNRYDFYGIYYRKISDFQIPQGHRHCVLEIKRYIEMKGLLHFATKENSFYDDALICSPTRNCATKSSTNEILQRQHPKGTVQENSPTTEVKDTDKEIEKLYSSLKTYYLNQKDGEKIFEAFLTSPPGQYINVYLKHLTDDSGNSYPSFSAHLICCLCGIKIPAGKYECRKNEHKSKQQKKIRTRWVYRNFTNHVKEKHLLLMMKDPLNIRICEDSGSSDSGLQMLNIVKPAPTDEGMFVIMDLHQSEEGLNTIKSEENFML